MTTYREKLRECLDNPPTITGAGTPTHTMREIPLPPDHWVDVEESERPPKGFHKSIADLFERLVRERDLSDSP